MTEVIDNDYHPIDSDLSATDDHWGTEKGASTGDASRGLAQAKEDNRPANKYQGNNQIQTRATMGTYSRLMKNK